MDLAVMKKRLQADWFRRYMVNPIALRPGTRMPSFWPDGNSTKPDILGGDSGKQIEAIWKYLALGEQAAPAGASGGGLLITASDEARIYRNFIQDAGPRAIGVGYPGEVNLAWDANHLRPALIWQGPFIDGAKHWTGRGQGFQKPAGFNTLKLPQGHSLWLSLAIQMKRGLMVNVGLMHSSRVINSMSPAFLLFATTFTVSRLPTSTSLTKPLDPLCYAERLSWKENLSRA